MSSPIFVISNEWRPFYLSWDTNSSSLAMVRECTSLSEIWILENMREHWRIQNAALGIEKSLTANQLGKRIHLDMLPTDKSEGDHQLWLSEGSQGGTSGNRIYNAEYGPETVLTIVGDSKDPPSALGVELRTLDEKSLLQMWTIRNPQ